MWALLGVVGPLTAHVSIATSILSAPWFRWSSNALSDLGHAARSEVAPIYNFGLALAGCLVAVYAVTVFRRHAKYTSIVVAVSAFLLQLVAVFDEVYGSLHQAVSVLFFVSLTIASVAYAVERKSLSASVAFATSLGFWAMYGAKVYSAGIAVPEIISVAGVSSWILLSAFRIYRAASTEKK